MRKPDKTKLSKVLANLSIGVKALLINCVVIFSLPLWYDIAGKGNLKLFQGEKQPLEVVKVNLEDPDKKVEKIRPRVQKQKIKPEHLSSDISSRFQLDLGVNPGGGSGVSVAGKSPESIIFSQNEVEVDPVRIGGRNPVFPPAFTDLGRGGKVEVEVVIDEGGRVVSSKTILEEPRGYGLKESTITAVKTWEFRPAMVNRVPVKVRVIIPFLF